MTVGMLAHMDDYEMIEFTGEYGDEGPASAGSSISTTSVRVSPALRYRSDNDIRRKR
jgi:hypothetical protein